MWEWSPGATVRFGLVKIPTTGGPCLDPQLHGFCFLLTPLLVRSRICWGFKREGCSHRNHVAPSKSEVSAAGHKWRVLCTHCALTRPLSSYQRPWCGHVRSCAPRGNWGANDSISGLTIPAWPEHNAFGTTSIVGDTHHRCFPGASGRTSRESGLSCSWEYHPGLNCQCCGKDSARAEWERHCWDMAPGLKSLAQIWRETAAKKQESEGSWRQSRWPVREVVASPVNRSSYLWVPARLVSRVQLWWGQEEADSLPLCKEQLSHNCLGTHARACTTA